MPNESIINDLLTLLSVDDIEMALESIGVSRQAYHSIFNVMQDALLRENLKKLIRPCLHKIMLCEMKKKLVN